MNRLEVALDLTLGGTVFSVPAGNIKRLSFEVLPYGFCVQLSFWFVCTAEASEDKIFAQFIKPDLATAQLAIDRKFDSVGEQCEPLVLKGLLHGKRFEERAFEALSGQPVLHRHYHVEFADRAQVLWKQHFPTALYVDSSLSALIDANLPAGVRLSHQWSAGKVSSPVLSLALGSGGRASFYDYLHWLLEQHHAGLFYDAKQDRYVIADSKQEFGKAVQFVPEDLQQVEVVLPTVVRSSCSVLNGSAAVTTREATIENSQKVSGVKRQCYMRSSVAADLSASKKREALRQAQGQVRAVVTFGRYPSTTMGSNLLAKLTDLPKTVFSQAQPFRVTHIECCAEAESLLATDDVDDESNSYQIDYRAVLEHQTEPHFVYPSYVQPDWSLQVEGLVVSEVGDQSQETYQHYRDKDTGVDYYKVEVPLWANKKVIAPYEPLMGSGHFYFPVYKGAKVLLALEHDRARIVGFVDWRAGARLPLETQGNHLLLGKKSEDQTSVRHVYKDGKPELCIERTHGQDRQQMEVSEGRIFLQTVATES